MPACTIEFEAMLLINYHKTPDEQMDMLVKCQYMYMVFTYNTFVCNSRHFMIWSIQ